MVLPDPDHAQPREYPALLTGLGLLPHTVVSIVVGMHFTPRLMWHTDSRALVSVGVLIGAAGFWWQSRIALDSGYLSGILGPAVVISLVAVCSTPITTIVTSGVNAQMITSWAGSAGV
ncbi:hypothetical protein [Kibdelosporangium aridum]|uniref:hypothetical protein n=1 Tax=Kibdelosporangium aridum TaxID=2030 RepID=UPI0035ED4D13